MMRLIVAIILSAPAILLANEKPDSSQYRVTEWTLFVYPAPYTGTNLAVDFSRAVELATYDFWQDCDYDGQNIFSGKFTAYSCVPTDYEKKR